jgi:hypothetical protein
MGYDFDVIVTKTIHSDNYTYNVSEMYYHAWDQIKHTLDIPDYELRSGSWKEAIQLENKYAVRALLAMIRQLECYPEIYRPMEPENGWGTYEGAIKFLKDTFHVMLKNTNSRLVIS